MIQRAKDKAGVALNGNYLHIVQSVEQFDRALCCLRFEGKLFVGSNYKRICRISKLLKREIDQYFKIEEKTVFPFLKKHIPRLSPIVSLLVSEQEGLKECMKSFEMSLLQIKNSNRQSINPRLIERLWGRGIYLVHFLRGHFLAEDMVVLKKIRNELRKDEMAQLNRSIEEQKANHGKKRSQKHH